MESPYKPPDAEVIDESTSVKAKGGWKFLFWLIAALEVISVLFMITAPEGSTLLETIVEVVIYGAILTALYGYAYDRKFFVQAIWGYLIPIGITWDVFSIVDAFDGEVVSADELYILIITLVVVAPLVVFQYMAIFRYRYRSPEIWRK